MQNRSKADSWRTAIHEAGHVRRDLSRLWQRQVALQTLQMRGYDRPSEGLWPVWRIELDLESDGDSG
jgi:hypothetical protein